MPGFTGISHVELTVRDAERSAAWYRETLGLETLIEPARPDWGPGVVTTVLHPATGLIIGLVQHEPSEVSAFSESRVGLDHLAFSVASRSELEAWVEHFDGHGIDHSGINDQPYGSVVVFRDPDNIQLELFVFSAG